MARLNLAAILVLAIAGCAPNAAQQPAPVAAAAPASANGQTQQVNANGVEGEITGVPARGSKFSRVGIGMSLKQVTDLIGEPTDQSSHVTGKGFIPFYFGGDTARIEYFYRGEGQLSFAPTGFGSANFVVRAINVNPAETGYAH